MKQKSNIFELTLKRRILIALANVLFVVLFGMICVGRSELLALALDGARSKPIGGLLMAFGLLCSSLSTLLIFRQIRVLHDANKDSDKGIHIGRMRVRPIMLIATMIVIGTFSFGSGYGIAFNELSSYVICIVLLLLSLLLAAAGLIVMAAGNKKVNAVFTVVASILCVAFIVSLACKMPAALEDISGGEELRTVKAKVVSVERSLSRLSNPGAQKVTVKSSSGEHVTFCCPVQASELEKDSTYVFSYYENTLYCSQWQKLDAPEPLAEIPEGAEK